MRTKNIFFLLFFIWVTHFFIISSAKSGQDEKVRFGLQAGNVNLLGNVSPSNANNLGYGVQFNYGTLDDLFINIGYLTSSHSTVEHTTFTLGGDYYFNTYDPLAFYFSGGAGFINNRFKLLSAVDTGFTVYAGLGIDFQVGEHFIMGLSARYHKAYEKNLTVNNIEYKSIDDSTSVQIRFLFSFGE